MALSRHLGALAIFALAGCSLQEGLQGDVRNLGDAINHCRDYTRNTLAGSPVISVDRLSTRESREYYDVFLNLDRQDKHGYVHCQVNMDGLIVEHSVNKYRKNKGGIFGGF